MIEKLDRDKLNLFWKFIYERQKIWQKRVVDEENPPWTKDEIIQNNRFTNIYRELDPGTQYAIQNILEQDASRQDKIFNIMIYRLIGRSETHSFLGFQKICDFEPKAFEEKLKGRRDEQGETIFTGAYMVAGYSQMGSSDKVENISLLFERIANDYSKEIRHLPSEDTLQEAYNTMHSIPGFGKFLAYQVIVDLLYPVKAYNGDSLLPFTPDDWAKAGPGARKGVKALRTKSGLRYPDVMKWLRNNQRSEFQRLNINFPFLKDGDGNEKEISLANIQNCLCEFYKYNKIRENEGRARRRFDSTQRRKSEELREIYRSAPNLTIE